MENLPDLAKVANLKNILVIVEIVVLMNY